MSKRKRTEPHKLKVVLRFTVPAATWMAGQEEVDLAALIAREEVHYRLRERMAHWGVTFDSCQVEED